LGDVLLAMGDQDGAIERLVEALNIPAVAKTAAQKLVPVFEELGRSADALAVAKRYLKGCC
jgi:thioredoxin-like negative regulator of GroEL